MLDLSGSVMSPITDEGLKAVSKYCPNLQNLGEILQLVRGLNVCVTTKDTHTSAVIPTLKGNDVNSY